MSCSGRGSGGVGEVAGAGSRAWLGGDPDVFENRIERKKAFESALSVLGLIERTSTTEPNPWFLRELR